MATPDNKMNASHNSSRHMPAELDGTATTNRGAGHWHARYGQIREWLVYEDQRIKEAARKAEAE